MVIYSIIALTVFYMLTQYLKTSKGLETEGRIIFIAGLRGAGKTYYLTHQALKYLKKGRPIYTNFEFYKEGVYKLTFEDLQNKLFPENAVIMYDEAHNELDSDNFRDKTVKESFKMFTQSRKLKYTIFIGSQNPIRVFKGLRDIADHFIWASKGLFFFNYDVYLSYQEFEHWERENAKWSAFKVRKKKKIFQAYNTYFLHTDLSDRMMIKNVPWIEKIEKPKTLKEKIIEFKERKKENADTA